MAILRVLVVVEQRLARRAGGWSRVEWDTGHTTARAGTAELLITREWAILADENDYTTGTFQQMTGRPPRPVADFLHTYRAEFL